MLSLLASRHPLRRVLPALAAAALAACAAGCGSTAPAGGIDVAALEHELATVSRLEKLSAGFEYDVAARCAPGADALHFSCRIDATSPRTREPNSWSVEVTCLPPGGSAPRCTTDNGYALQ